MLHHTWCGEASGPTTMKSGAIASTDLSQTQICLGVEGAKQIEYPAIAP